MYEQLIGFHSRYRPRIESVLNSSVYYSHRLGFAFTRARVCPLATRRHSIWPRGQEAFRHNFLRELKWQRQSCLKRFGIRSSYVGIGVFRFPRELFNDASYYGAFISCGRSFSRRELRSTKNFRNSFQSR